MNKFKIPMELKCSACNHIAIYDCDAMNKKICRFCCDQYQLSERSIDRCLECSYLFREVGYSSKSREGLTIFHEYKDKFVFDSDPDAILLKVIKLYESFGVNKAEEMLELAINYSFCGREGEAIDLYNKILNKNLSKDYKMKVYAEIGNTMLRVKQINEARDAYVKSIDYGNKEPKIYRKLGEVYSFLKEYSQAIYYHEKSLNIYFAFEWCDNGFESDDFLNFTNYYHLATLYAEVKINEPDKAIQNAGSFLNHYGNFEYIKERYFTKDIIYGDQFMPKLIVSMYKLISLMYIKLENFSQAKDNIRKARVLLQQDTNLAKIEGFIDGKLESDEMKLQYEKMKQELETCRNLIMKSMGRNNITIGGDLYMENKFHIENKGTIGTQIIGDNTTFNNSDTLSKEISNILLEITEKISVIGDENTQKHIENISQSIKVGKFTGMKNNLSNLLVSVTAGCITNNMTTIQTKLCELINTLQ